MPLLTGAYRIHSELDDAFRVAVSACRFARVLAAVGEPVAAASVLASGRALLDEIGGEVAWVAKMNTETLDRLRAELDEGRLAEAEETGATVSADDAVAFALELLA